MRKNVVLAVLALLLAGMIALLVARPREPYTAPREIVESREAGVDAAPSGSASASASAAPTPPPVVDAASVVKPLLDRPLRVSAAGWELLAPGVADDKPSPELTIELASAEWPEIAQARLARGGADPQGADIALVPLPELVLGYERLRALDPRVFHVVGFSRGREELRALAKDGKPEPEVRVGAWDAAGRALALFVLGGQGVPLEKVRFLAPSVPEAKGAPWMAQLWNEPAEAGYRTVLSTAEASRLVPLCAVAARSSVEKNEPAFRRWVDRWQAGIGRVKADAPEIARLVAQRQGAPDAASVVDRLGRVELVDAATVASLLGATERAPMTIESLFALYWQLFRAAAVVTAPPPATPPVVATFVTPQAAPRPDAGTARVTGDAGAPVGAAGFVFKIPEGKLDERALATHVALTSAVFDRFVVRVSGKNARAVVADAHARHAVEAQVFAGSAPVPAQTALVLEIVPR